MKRIFGFIKLIRPINGLLMGFAVLVGASFVLTESFSINLTLNLFLGYITSFILTSASMSLNDFYDKDIDAINEPNRPIPAGIVNPFESIFFAVILSIIGLVAASILSLRLNSIWCIIIALVTWLISVMYNTKGKKTGLFGNFLVSACVAIPFIFGNFVVGNILSTNTFLISLLAFLSNTGREITKGIVDIPGDKNKGIKTTAVLYGEKYASYIASVFFIIAVSLSILPLMLKLVSIWYIPFIIIADLGFIMSSKMLISESSSKNARRIKKYILIWMIFAMLSFLFGSFFN
jgi:geranylgeranylglycerol-phosphate geranylgeranyltransferase